MGNFIVGISPHIRSENSTQRIMLDVILALCPAMIASVILFGPRTILLTLVSAGVCVFAEFLWEKCLHQPVTVSDLSAAVTGILLAFNVPYDMPVWQLIVGDVFAIIVVKMLFGGLGRNFMNPALVGRIVLMFSFTGSMTNYRYPANGIDALSGATPLAEKSVLVPDNFMVLFLGNHGGVIGETCILALLIGGAYLLIRRVIAIWIPLCYLLSLLVFSALFGMEGAGMSLFAGGAVLGAFYMATDYVTSPLTDKGKILFGIGCGLITALIRVYANYTEGVTFAILIMNLLVPYIDGLTMHKPIGEIKKNG
ncbi:MAG: RnfABCDGE type electron transport complex subunit D [Lachnospiraceae bacterium]|nr:RnfABCDGE type electron transport complex subunit D [Lachnospiraceae bacterium]